MRKVEGVDDLGSDLLKYLVVIFGKIDVEIKKICGGVGECRR